MWIAKALKEGFLHNLCPCFDIVFAQLGFIARTSKKFVKIAAVAEFYLMITHILKRIKEVAVPNVPSFPNVLICCWKNINQIGRNFFVPNLQHYQFRKNVWKNRTFFMKIIWIWVSSELVVNLLLFRMMLNLAFGHL